MPGERTVELVLAHPTGQTELAEGKIDVRPGGFKLRLHAHVVNTSTAKPVERIIRTLELDGDRLRTTLEMEAVGVEITQHLSSVLTRVEPENHR
ncbi:FABP family protein [Gulosibacter molinativorax]|uniref:FABP family protein n=1 Tax=Gulosibacter molinativorax TaxID=256821 RepID=UPI000D0B9CC4|nr:heme-binding beta-barrel domain-containing protein [Gulosibacter molinativorax]